MTTSNGRGAVALERGKPATCAPDDMPGLVPVVKAGDLSLTITCAVVEKVDCINVIYNGPKTLFLMQLPAVAASLLRIPETRVLGRPLFQTARGPPG